MKSWKLKVYESKDINPYFSGLRRDTTDLAICNYTDTKRASVFDARPRENELNWSSLGLLFDSINFREGTIYWGIAHDVARIKIEEFREMDYRTAVRKANKLFLTAEARREAQLTTRILRSTLGVLRRGVR